MKKLCLILISYFIIDIYINNNVNVANIEYINRRIYSFNRGIDYFFFNPSVKLYIEIIPNVIKSHINNFFTNIEELEDVPFNIIFGSRNDNKKIIIKTFINTTLGCLGILDHTNSFNLTLSKHSFNEKIMTNDKYSTYLVIPLIGPGTFKTHVSLIMHKLCNPLVYLNTNVFIYFIIYAINKKTNFIYDINFFHNSMLDGYIFLKSAFLQKNLNTQPNNDFLTEPP